MPDSDAADPQYSVLDAVQELNEEFQANAEYGAVACDGIAGFHTLFNHDAELDFATGTALHAALEEVFMEVALDPDLVRQNQGEVTPRAMATELREQMQSFMTVNDRFIDRLCDEFEETLRGYQADLQEGDA